MSSIKSNIISVIALALISFIVLKIVSYQYNVVYHTKYNYGSIEEQYKELDCLTENVYFESASEPLSSKIGVAQVTLNRVNSKRYANTICGVVHEKHQFSWTMDKPKSLIKIDKRAWEDARLVAKKVMFEGESIPCLENALFYHTTGVNPTWNRNMKMVCVLGHHKFFEG